MIITRRTSLKALGAGALWTTLGPGFAAASVETDRRFVFIFLRGGMDGLSAVPAYGDPQFGAARGPLADGPPGAGTDFDALKLDGLFALNPDLKFMHTLFTQGELTVFHATCHDYRDRSHFDAQDSFDRGSIDKTVKTGWLNRALVHLPARWSTDRENVALGLGPTLPLSLRGDAQVGSWSPPTAPQASADTMERLARLYRADERLGPLLASGLSTESMGNAMGGMDDMGGKGFGTAVDFIQYAKAAATFLAAADGPRIVTIDYGNWDSHSGQNDRNIPGPENGNYAGRFPEMYLGLDRGLAALREGLGPDIWSRTAVMLVTEFGRTVKINGTQGTDHGTGGAAFLLGGAVQGGRIIADWPGLRDSDLLDGRDLRPTTDLRAGVKGVLVDHLGLDEALMATAIFPGSQDVAPLTGLIRV
ncbi:MAG: DUF1501 domain-containing protein [Alphaproteobacteria bacterium]|nr:DUF1501 domain-containing protein [Alphaproteobacteria bacterium]